MQAELDSHLGQEQPSNRKNGSTSKTNKSTTGNFELNTPRDRAGTFEPQLVKKHQTHLTNEIERKILALFALGTSYQDIRGHIEDLYGISVSSGTLNTITDKLLPELQAWRKRDLDGIYPIGWLDAIHYKIKENGRYISKAIYTILGLNIEGKKELLVSTNHMLRMVVILVSLGLFSWTRFGGVATSIARRQAQLQRGVVRSISSVCRVNLNNLLARSMSQIINILLKDGALSVRQKGAPRQHCRC